MNPNKVIEWREALVTLSDQHFFDLMRLYIGEIKTPFNKQNLIQDLSAFLRNEENIQRIIISLDFFDKQVLSAIQEVAVPTQHNLVNFFSNTFSYQNLYQRLLNLEERLLIFRRTGSDNREYAINPLLEKHLKPHIGLFVLVAPESRSKKKSYPLKINNFNLAAFYNYFYLNNVTTKVDGSMRKKTISDLLKLFPHLNSDEDLVFLLFSFLNLGLLAYEEDNIKPEKNRWQWFSQLDINVQLAWIIAARYAFSSQEQLYKNAQACLDFITSLHHSFQYSKAVLERYAFLCTEKSAKLNHSVPSRFFSMMQKHQEIEEEFEDLDIVASFLRFGAIIESDELYEKNSALSKIYAEKTEEPLLVVSPSLTVTLFPGFSLGVLLELLSFMEIKEIQVASICEITRKACVQAFSSGMDPDSMLSLLTSNSNQEVPQNVNFSIHDWYQSYKAFSLDFGFILQVEESRRLAFENNEKFSRIIQKKLSEGIYLLSCTEYEDIDQIFKEAGFGAAPLVSNEKSKKVTMPMPLLNINKKSLLLEEEASLSKEQVCKQQKELQKTLTESLDAMTFSKDILEVLRSRIKRKIIINSKQLTEESVRLEKTEAIGMDFLGKVRLVEYAITHKSLLELELENEPSSDGSIDTLDTFRVLGTPLRITKKVGDALLILLTEPEGKEREISLGKAMSVKRIRGSIFAE